MGGAYTRTREEEQRGRFLEEILQATQDAPLTVVLTLRGDFFGQALSYRPLADRLQDAVVTLGPMTREELALAVAEPAKKVHLSFEPGLMERLLDDVGLEPGNLPLLEFSLTRLWEERRGGQLLHQAYEDMGRVQGAVARQAEDLYQQLGPLEQQAAERVFLELVQAGENTEDTRRRAALSDLGGETRELVQKLADARLVVTGREEASGRDLVEVAHEALIQNWQRLQGWLNADREFLLWRQRLRHDLEDWQRTGQDDGALLRGAQLVEAQDWLARRPEDLGAGERQFIQAGVALKEREEEENREKQRRELEQAQALAAEQQKRAEIERRSRRHLSLLSAALLVAFLGAIGGAAFAWVQRNHAKTQTNIAFSRQLAAQANPLINSQPDLALLLGAEAVAAYKAKPTAEAMSVLLMALQKSPQLRRYLHAHKDPVKSVAFSPDGKTLASGSEDKTIRLWDVDLQSWMQRACAIANRNLTKEEWRRYMGDRPYRKTCPDLPGPED